MLVGQDAHAKLVSAVSVRGADGVAVSVGIVGSCGRYSDGRNGGLVGSGAGTYTPFAE